MAVTMPFELFSRPLNTIQVQAIPLRKMPDLLYNTDSLREARSPLDPAPVTFPEAAQAVIPGQYAVVTARTVFELPITSGGEFPIVGFYLTPVDDSTDLVGLCLFSSVFLIRPEAEILTVPFSILCGKTARN